MVCSFYKGGHFVVNCWKKNGYPPYIKARFAKANSIVSITEDMEVQEDIDQDYFDNGQGETNLYHHQSENVTAK